MDYYTIHNAIAYQDGSVVSKELVKKSTGSLTLFAFDGGQGLSEHTAPYDAIVQVIDGEAEITVAGEMTRVPAGDMIIMPAGKPHSLHAATRFKMMLIMIKEVGTGQGKEKVKPR